MTLETDYQAKKHERKPFIFFSANLYIQEKSLKVVNFSTTS